MKWSKIEAEEQIRMILEVKNKNIGILQDICLKLLQQYEDVKIELISCIYEEPMEELKKLDAEITATRDKIKGLIGC